ncbi:hypothetical protein SUGI_0220350 [Cryptomeria japonica]|nr:hypothetical protein SUGI_0220350 [Cryptomeria japonica]
MTDVNKTLSTDWNNILLQFQNQLTEANRAGEAAAIIINYDAPNPFSNAYFMLELMVGPTEGKLLTTYAAMSITSLNTKPALVVPVFSAHGSSIPSSGILKLDVMALGVDILAGYPPNIPVINVGSDNTPQVTQCNLESGTSMATPHVADSAALVKAMHPGWSPTSIHSALMTKTLQTTPHKERSRQHGVNLHTNNQAPMRQPD